MGTHQQLPRPKRHEKKIFFWRRIWKPRKMKLTVLFLVFGFVVFAWCEKAKNVDGKTEEKKQDLKAKLMNLSKAEKRAKDYNGDRQKDWSSTSYTRRHRMTTRRPRHNTTLHYYTSSSSCRGLGEYCNYSYQCCYTNTYCYNNRCEVRHQALQNGHMQPTHPRDIGCPKRSGSMKERKTGRISWPEKGPTRKVTSTANSTEKRRTDSTERESRREDSK